MAGSLLGPDQIRKVNATFPALVAHIRALLAADHTGVGLMKVHCMVESFDSDEMARIFRELSFISPLEKKALVRAAIYELLAKEPALYIAPEMVKPILLNPKPDHDVAVSGTKVFTPPQFNLNVNKSDVEEIAKTDTKPTPPPATSTHTPLVANQVKAGEKEKAEQQAKIDAAVAKLREASVPKPIEIQPIQIMDVPADANLQDAFSEEQ